ncbi:MAG: helix-turn-helix domain-containing protein [Anaerolineales bacterium]|nr:helix-turn-helix domain-containing protein [Anaerolineales bacterium]
MNTSIPFDQVLDELMQDPEFRREYEALEPEYQLARQFINLRLERGLTQAQLAERMGTKQSAVSRLENIGINPTIGYLRQVAEALDARLEITLKPLEQAG